MKGQQSLSRSTHLPSESEYSTHKPVKILHFSDAHIDIANYGRHDPETALPVRVMDFLNALDQVIEVAINETVDLVVFAGDAYKDRNPQPTFQKAWGQRIMRLSDAGIPIIMLVGNHDVSPAVGRANTLQEFKTLHAPNVFVADSLQLLGPDQLGIPAEVITVPWIAPNALIAREDTSGKSLEDILHLVEDRIGAAIMKLIDRANPDLPLILSAHASVQGAKFGSEKSIMLGQEMVLSGKIIHDRRLDYVALGHIHKHQSLNDERHPPVVYSGSIERIDFGEVKEDKGFVLAEVKRGQCSWQFKKIDTRQFVDLKVETPSADSFMADLLEQLPSSDRLAGTICRLRLQYPLDWEPLLDESLITNHFREALSIQIVKNRETNKRSRLGDTVMVESLTKEELLSQYWRTIGLESEETEAMESLAKEVFSSERIDSSEKNK